MSGHLIFECRGILRMLALAGAAMVAGGCEFKGQPASPRASREANVSHWRIEPVDMRIYPSTRFTRYEDQLILAARLEFFDEMNDSTKAVGWFRLELHTDQPGARGKPQTLYTWGDIPALTVEEQRQYYDPITHTYLFRLRIDDAGTPLRKSRLAAMYISPNGQRLETQASLNPDRSELNMPFEPQRLEHQPVLKPREVPAPGGPD